MTWSAVPAPLASASRAARHTVPGLLGVGPCDRNLSVLAAPTYIADQYISRVLPYVKEGYFEKVERSTASASGCRAPRTWRHARIARPGAAHTPHPARTRAVPPCVWLYSHFLLALSQIEIK